jgi:hypothetical protein
LTVIKAANALFNRLLPTKGDPVAAVVDAPATVTVVDEKKGTLYGSHAIGGVIMYLLWRIQAGHIGMKRPPARSTG